MNVMLEEWEVRQEGDWSIVIVSGRVDSFNCESFCQQLRALVNAGKKKLALDLSRVKFLSMPSIKYLTTLANELEKGGGQFALLAASEKLKRQIDIYATLKTMHVVRRENELREQKN